MSTKKIKVEKALSNLFSARKSSTASDNRPAPKKNEPPVSSVVVAEQVVAPVKESTPEPPVPELHVSVQIEPQVEEVAVAAVQSKLPEPLKETSSAVSPAKEIAPVEAPVAVKDVEENLDQMVIFVLAGEYFGVNIANVDGIIKMQSITELPHAATHVVGLTNLRGSVLPVIDLRVRFGLPSDTNGGDVRIIVVLVSGEKVGLIVDSVSEVLSVSRTEIEPPPPIVTTVDTAFITGIAKVDSRLITILNLEKAIRN